MQKLPIYKLVINDDDTDTSGVQAVALVDQPAIEQNWQVFTGVKQLFQTTNAEKKIISGALMVADMPIYRKDQQGEYYVVFDKQSIFNIVKKYFRNNNTSEVNMMHDSNKMVQGVYMIESFIIDKERGITTPKGFDELPEGSWFGSFKVDNQDVWDNFIKTGKFKGFSVEGYFQPAPVEAKDDDILQKIKDILNS